MLRRSGLQIWFSHGDKRSRGVMIMFRKDLNLQVHNVIADDKGRYVILYATLRDKKWVIANIYAPNEDCPDFFQKCFTDIDRFYPDHSIIGGDLNLGLDPIIDRLGSSNNNKKATDWLNMYLDNNLLLDCWRHMHPDNSGFTWRKTKPKRIFSRLDYVFVSGNLEQFLSKTSIIPGFRTDHSIVAIVINYCPKTRGSGYWKLNTSLLNDHEYVRCMNDLIEVQLDSNMGTISKRTRWELIKLAIRGSTIQFATRKKKSNRLKLNALEKKLVSLEKEIEEGTTILENTENQIRLVMHERNELVRIKTKGAMVRSRANWLNFAEKPSKYFLNLEKKRAQGKTLHRLLRDNDEIIEDKNDILSEIKNYYEQLYTTGRSIDLTFTESLNIPKLDDELKIELNTPLQIQEFSAALAKMPNGKSPGLDGLPYEFYKMFWTKLKEPYFEAIMEGVADGELHLTARQDILSLLEKSGRDGLRLKNWRPLSLLSADSKLYTKVLAMRLQKTQDQLIHPEQTGFVKKRHMATNVIKILEIISHCDEHEIDGVLISFDFLKAFDTVEWESIYLVLKLFNFGEGFINLVKVVFKNPLLCAANNGFMSEFITPTRGCRQGCCLSPILFTFVVEMLGLAIRQEENIEGIKIGEAHLKSGQFADDLWAALKAKEANINEMLKLLDRFYKFAGLKINPDKCAVLKIGPWKETDAKFYTLKKLYWSPGPIKILGFCISTNIESIREENFMQLLKKAEGILANWKSRNLTLIGKITVVNHLINSLFIHKLTTLPTPGQIFFSKYKEMVVDFLWEGRVPKISYDKLVQNHDKLGLKLVDLRIKETALKCSWIANNYNTPHLEWLYDKLPVRDNKNLGMQFKSQGRKKVRPRSKY